MSIKPRIMFLSHGGGPMPLLGDEGHTEMVDCLKVMTGKIKRPSAIIVISAHWEEKVPTITSGKMPSLIYDYSGFPEESYSINYPCPGDSALASQIHSHLSHAGFEPRLDDLRGFDHGLFVPLKIMFPDADIPCVQLSLLNSLDAADHIKMGEALQGLNYKNLLIIGSGFSFHNMRAFFQPVTRDSETMNEAFEDWLIATCSSTSLVEEERAQRLIEWTSAPSAHFCHPREEHLLPLHVCYGIANTHCSESFELRILNRKSSMYLW